MLQNSCAGDGALVREAAFQRWGRKSLMGLSLHGVQVRNEGAQAFGSYRKARRASFTRRSH